MFRSFCSSGRGVAGGSSLCLTRYRFETCSNVRSFMLLPWELTAAGGDGIRPEHFGHRQHDSKGDADWTGTDPSRCAGFLRASALLPLISTFGAGGPQRMQGEDDRDASAAPLDVTTPASPTIVSRHHPWLARRLGLEAEVVTADSLFGNFHRQLEELVRKVVPQCRVKTCGRVVPLDTEVVRRSAEPGIDLDGRAEMLPSHET